MEIFIFIIRRSLPKGEQFGKYLWCNSKFDKCNKIQATSESILRNLDYSETCLLRLAHIQQKIWSYTECTVHLEAQY